MTGTYTIKVGVFDSTLGYQLLLEWRGGNGHGGGRRCGAVQTSKAAFRAGLLPAGSSQEWPAAPQSLCRYALTGVTINSPRCWRHAAGLCRVPPPLPAGKTVTFHIWIPTGSTVASIPALCAAGSRRQLDLDRQLAADFKPDGRGMEHPYRCRSRKRRHAPVPTGSSIPNNRRLDWRLLHRRCRLVRCDSSAHIDRRMHKSAY